MIQKIWLVLIICTGMSIPAFAADFTNFIGMEFQTISSGHFYMGSCKPEGKEQEKDSGLFGFGSQSPCLSGGAIDRFAEPDEMPQHQVEITRDFQISVCEVTLGQYLRFIKATARPTSVKFNKHNSLGEDRAVTWVSWFQAQNFLTWLNDTKPPDDAGTYRLPSEAEWEYAARAGSTDAYFFGNSSLEIGRYAWTIKDGPSYGQVWSMPVGKKQPNPWGLYDIYGNVWEWVHDVYSATYYEISPEQDPRGPDTGPEQVLRGCHLFSSARNCRSAKRHHMPADQRDASVGFRVVRDIH